MAGFRLIVVGIAVSALLGSTNAWLLLRSRTQQAMQVAVWGVGSLADVDVAALGVCSAMVAVMLFGVALLARGLHELELGDEVAVAHGVRVRLTWVLAVVLGVALTAVVTSVAGPITFLALAAPQVVQRATRSSGIPLAASGLAGAGLLSAADLAAQHLMPEPVPVGLVTVVLGGAFLVHLVLAERRQLR